MSDVTNVILSFSINENEVTEGQYGNMVKINEWLDNHGYGVFGQDADDVAGGNKHLETPLYVVAFNYFGSRAFADFVEFLNWNEPENVQLLIQEQNENKFMFLIDGIKRQGMTNNDLKKISKAVRQASKKMKEMETSIIQAAAALGKAWQKYWDSLPDNVKKDIMKEEKEQEG